MEVFVDLRQSQGSFCRIQCSHKEVFLDLSVSVDIDITRKHTF